MSSVDDEVIEQVLDYLETISSTSLAIKDSVQRLVQMCEGCKRCFNSYSGQQEEPKN